MRFSFLVFDATSKLQSGLTHGNLADFGDYDLCLSIEHNATSGLIKGQYCFGLMNLLTSVSTKQVFIHSYSFFT